MISVAQGGIGDGRVAIRTMKGNTVGHEKGLELAVLSKESLSILQAFVEGHLGADELFLNGTKVDFFAFAMGTESAISKGSIDGVDDCLGSDIEEIAE